jgi:hypothetical protein
MKLNNNDTPTPSRASRPQRSLARTTVLGALMGSLAIGRAENVDSELVLLVDITRPGLSQTQFSQLMDGYATAFTSTQVLDSIQSGEFGRIAVSMMFYGNTSTQIVGIPWMEIGNMTQAQQFASLARSMVMPFSVSTADLGAGLTAATISFGTETGHADNGFQSVIQTIEVASAKAQPNGTAGATSASSSSALASGVDLINGLALGNQANSIDSFYTNNVIGSTIPGVSPTSTTSAINGALASTVSSLLNDTVQTGATSSVTAVPEPASLLGLIPATLLFLRRRRR